tara:strand:- start:1551 stop:2330 length:780 start_codon:yes stop_codon:yes gene_type:complete
MYITHILPNGKEVKLKEILYKDLRTFNLYGEATIKGRLNFLESFIITKGLNIMEKLYALLYLRLVCIGDNLIIGSEKGDVGVSLSFVKDNVGGINNITKVIEDKGIEYTLDYPLNFNQGDDDFLLSVVTKIKFNDKELDIGKLSEEEYEAVLLKLPKGLYGHVDKFLEHNSNFFELMLLDERENLKIKPLQFNILHESFTYFIISLFNCLDVQGYRDLLFALSKRINDVTFLTNCTYVELNDYFEMYKKEIEESNTQSG